MEMTNEEILRSWRQALDRTKQIQVLAELNLCGRSRIVEILIEGGVDPHELPSVPKYQRGSCYNPVKKEEAPGKSRRWIWNPNRTKTADEIIKQAKERYAHLKKAYGDLDPYVVGFGACIDFMEEKR